MSNETLDFSLKSFMNLGRGMQYLATLSHPTDFSCFKQTFFMLYNILIFCLNDWYFFGKIGLYQGGTRSAVPWFKEEWAVTTETDERPGSGGVWQSCAA